MQDLYFKDKDSKLIFGLLELKDRALGMLYQLYKMMIA
jgi:hypothetical protein|nr:MAG TPA: hypothetical protein [Caudoviricetes sp.]